MSVNFVDSNVVIYHLDKDDAKQAIALKLLASDPMISTQVLGEVSNVMRRKLGYGWAEVRAVVSKLTEVARVHTIRPSTILRALDTAQRYGFSYYDSLIVAAAVESGCTTLYSEDLQDGQRLDSGLTIRNPFKIDSLR